MSFASCQAKLGKVKSSTGTARCCLDSSCCLDWQYLEGGLCQQSNTREQSHAMLNRILLLPGVVCLIHQHCRELVDSVFELYYDGQLHSKSRAISLKERQCTCMYMYLHVHDASIATHAVAIDCSILLCIQVHTRTNSYIHAHARNSK